MADVEDQQYENFDEPQAQEEQVNFDEEAEAEALAYATTAELPEIKLFGRWSCDDVHVSDMSLAVSLVLCIFFFWNIPSNKQRFQSYFNKTIHRITSLLKKNTLATFHIQLVVMLPNVSVRHNVQSLND